MGMGPFLKDALLGHTLLGSLYTMPGTVYLSLATSVNSMGTAFWEITEPSYQRQRMIFGAPTSFVVTNPSTMYFGTALTTWGTARHIGIWDAPTGGNLLYYYDLSGTGRRILPNQAVYVNSGAFEIRF